MRLGLREVSEVDMYRSAVDCAMQGIVTNVATAALIYAFGWLVAISSCFFFQAEDGIRDYKVTGVQTCALPICAPPFRSGGWCSTTAPACDRSRDRPGIRRGEDRAPRRDR